MFGLGNVELPFDGTKFKQILQELSDLEALPVECLGKKTAGLGRRKSELNGWLESQ